MRRKPKSVTNHEVGFLHFFSFKSLIWPWLGAEQQVCTGHQQRRGKEREESRHAQVEAENVHPYIHALGNSVAKTHFKDLYLLTRKDAHNTLQSEKRRFRKVYQLRFDVCKDPCIYLYMYAEKILWSKTHSNANSGEHLWATTTWQAFHSPTMHFPNSSSSQCRDYLEETTFF